MNLSRIFIARPVATSVLVASLFSFKEEEFFEVEDAIRESGPPTVDFGTSAGGSGEASVPSPEPSTPAASTPTPAPQATDVPESPDQPAPPNPTG